MLIKKFFLTKSLSVSIPTGQGISVTPIQQVTGVAAAVNGGHLYTPYILRSISEPETNGVIVLNKPKKVSQVISEETSKLVRHALEHVVAYGTGRNAYIENYRVGGKTGTAQKVSDGVYMVGNYILSFIGLFPADNPDYVIYVAIDNPKGITQYGGTVSAPVAQDVLLSIIDYKGYKASPNELLREYFWFDTRYLMLNDVVGMEIKEATKSLSNFRVEYSGNGKSVIEQSPKAGIYIKEGSIVKLMLN